MRFLIISVLLITIAGCKSKQADLSSDAPIKPNEFVKAFNVLDNGFFVNDSNIVSMADTVSINIKQLQRFVPDTLIKRLMSGDINTSFHPIGRIDKPEEKYLVLLSLKNKKPTATVLVIDKKNEFITAKDLFTTHNSDGYKYSLSINREPTFFITREKNTGEKEMKFTRMGWAFNGQNFIQVVKESNERSDKLTAIINPLDTFKRDNPYSGNYVEDDRNFISLRDGRTRQEYLFFLHIDKNDGNCTGELKGEMRLTDSTHAVYSTAGDPCVIDFTFDRNIIAVKEKGSCGNRRGMDCFFEDAYTKKKEPKKKIESALAAKPLVMVTKPVVVKPVMVKKTTPKPTTVLPIVPAAITPKTNKQNRTAAFKPKKEEKPATNTDNGNPYE